MGIEIEAETFEAGDYARFFDRLQGSLRALRTVLERPGFGQGPPSLGAELELHLVDNLGRPMPINRQVLASTLDGRVTLEVDRFNMEINAPPFALAGAPFSALGAELTEALTSLHEAAARHGARVAVIGILPTLEQADLVGSVLTDSPRYRALDAAVRGLRGEPFPVHIEGHDRLSVQASDVTFEGANTSFQLHLRVPPESFAPTYNAAQMATGPTLALAGNSPLFLGQRLWDETRIALFRQSVDDRGGAAEDDFRPARVSFGHGWVRRGALELFEESVRLHEPLLPVLSADDPEAVARGSGVPELSELKLHHGTVWRWNRAVFDAALGGHLRIELRSLPAGPSVVDMVANAAFYIGLTLGLAPLADDLVTRFTHGHARHNFYQAARHGLDARLLWPEARPPSPRLVPAADLVQALLPIAEQGLSQAGVSTAEIAHWLGIIAARIRTRQTGARWQRARYEQARVGRAWQLAAAEMLERYLELSHTNQPVHTWPRI